jgi:hypothetical protein
MSDEPQVTTEQLLAPLHPDENALTPLLQANVDEGMLREIAEADYGWEADRCYALLQPMLVSGSVPYDWNLREVLELIRWSEPGDPSSSPGGYGTRGHWMRLFACTALVRLAARHPEWFGGESETLAQLISSAIELGHPVARAAACTLAWRFLECPGTHEDPAFLAFAILLLAAHLERGEDRGLWLKQLAIWVEEEEARARCAIGSPEQEWLFGLAPFHLRETVWRSLARRILASPESRHPHAADEELRLLGELIAGV